MIKRFLIVLGILFLTFGAVQAESLLSQEDIIKKVIKSIETESHLWFSTGSYLVYAESRDNVKILKDEWYPYRNDLAKVVVSFNFGEGDASTNYVKITKPFESFVKGKDGARLLIEVKIFILKSLQRDVGRVLEARKRPEPVPKEITKLKTKDDEPEKL